MKTEKFSFVAIATLAMVTTATCLDLLDVQEGSCGAIEDVSTLDDVDPTVLDRLFFISGGSKYQLYRYARGHLYFDELRDYKLYYEACLFKNVSVEEGSGSTFGFGDQQLVTYDVRRANQNDETGTALVTTERPGPGIVTGETFTSKITLTDNENYAVVVHCWENVKQKSWSLYTRHFTLETDTRRMVEEHVMGLGFDRDNVAFLEYGSCRLDDDYDDTESLDEDFQTKDQQKTTKSNSKSKDKDDSSSTPKNNKNSKSSDKTTKSTSKSSTSSSGKSSSSSKDKSSSGSKDKSSSGQKDKSSENKTNKSVLKNKSSHPDKSTSDSKDKSLGSKSKDKSSSGSKYKSSESHNKSHPKHTSSSSHSNKSMKDETSDSKHENDHDHQGKKDTQKSDTKNKGRSHNSTDHSSEEDSSEEKFGRGNRRFRSGGHRRFGNVGGGWKR